jgi:hypothetical protein
MTGRMKDEELRLLTIAVVDAKRFILRPSSFIL